MEAPFCYKLASRSYYDLAELQQATLNLLGYMRRMLGRKNSFRAAIVERGKSISQLPISRVVIAFVRKMCDCFIQGAVLWWNLVCAFFRFLCDCLRCRKGSPYNRYCDFILEELRNALARFEAISGAFVLDSRVFLELLVLCCFWRID